MSRRPPSTDGWGGIGQGWAITSTLIAGILVWGGLGYLVDLWVGTPRVFAAIGILVGAAGGIYLVYQRFGKADRAGRGDREQS